MQVYSFKDIKTQKVFYYLADYEVENPYYNTERNRCYFRGKCDNCGGKGRGPWVPAEGICFKCNGSGYHTYSLKTYVKQETAIKHLERYNIEKQQEESKRLENNLKYSLKVYGESFYIITDKLPNTTYKLRDQIKAKGGRWQPALHAWLCKESISLLNNLKVNTKDVLNEYNIVDSEKLYQYVYNNG